MTARVYPIPNEKYQHYKGGQYQVICMCNHTDTNEPLVIYKSLSFGSQYARPFSEWYNEVDVVEFAKRNISTRRFELINK